MNIEEILKAATPRPWKNTSAIPDDPEQSTMGWTGTPPLQMDADDALAELAVNAYESDRAKIKALVSVVEQLKSLLDDQIIIRNISHDDDYNRFVIEGGRVTKMVQDGLAALNLTGGE